MIPVFYLIGVWVDHMRGRKTQKASQPKSDQSSKLVERWQKRLGFIFVGLCVFSLIPGFAQGFYDFWKAFFDGDILGGLTILGVTLAVVWLFFRGIWYIVKSARDDIRRSHTRQAKSEWSSAQRARNSQRTREKMEREAQESRQEEADERARQSTSSQMSFAQAQLFLGVHGSASDAEIGAAFNRLLKAVHPDKGGSSYFTQQVIQAREVLLKKPRAAA